MKYCITNLLKQLETLEKKKKELESDIEKYEKPKNAKDEPRIYKIKQILVYQIFPIIILD